MTAHTAPAPLASGGLENLQHLVHRQEHKLAADILARQQSTTPQPPRGWPAHIDGPRNWSRSTSNQSPAHITTLYGFGNAEVQAAMKRLGGKFASVLRFPSPTIS